jgi:uncharacterized protein (DUF4415 family)
VKLIRDEYGFSKGRRGPVIPSPGKTRITIFLDDDIIEAFRTKAEAEGKGYQTLINEALRAGIQPENAPITQKTLRRIIREELHTA